VLVLEQLSLYVYACMRMQTAMDQALIGSTNRERRCQSSLRRRRLMASVVGGCFGSGARAPLFLHDAAVISSRRKMSLSRGAGGYASLQEFCAAGLLT
jgi:hypothetical protein